MSQTLEIIQLGNPLLWAVAETITNPFAQEVVGLANDLVATMIGCGAVGLAAPQVGISKRMIALRSFPSQRYPDAPEIQPLVMLNPKIIDSLTAENVGWETCYSIPGIGGMVWRPDRIEVEYTDLEGATCRQVYSGLPSRVVQHETDHLDGVVYLDRVRSTHDLYSQVEMLKHSERVSGGESDTVRGSASDKLPADEQRR